MPYALFCEPDGRVGVTHHRPDTLTPERLAQAVVVDAIPPAPPLEQPADPEAPRLAQSLYVVDGKLEWRTFEREWTTEELAARQTAALEQRLAAIESLLAQQLALMQHPQE